MDLDSSSKMRSVVIRGSINNSLSSVVQSIRNWFDEQLVICTWKQEENKINSEIESQVNKVVFIDDPGPGPIQNIKRQLLSFQEGFNNSSGNEILITRSDMLFSKDIFSFLQKSEIPGDTFCFVKDKIIIGNIMTIKPESNEIPNTFRISDWFHCSTRESLESLVCGIDLVFGADSNLIQKYKLCTEKLWIQSVLSKKFGFDLYNSENYDKHFWSVLVNNFQLYNSSSTLGTSNFKYWNQPENLPCYVTEADYNSHL